MGSGEQSGMSGADGRPPTYALRLRQTIERVAPVLNDLSDEETLARPAPGKWSAREVVGHLVDSACNNHMRFVRAQIDPEYTPEPYAQDDWVAVQHYDGVAWPDLVALWRAYNLHIAHVMCGATEASRARRRNWQSEGLAFGAARLDTLDHLMRDYVDHLEHHMNQLPGIGPIPGREE